MSSLHNYLETRDFIEKEHPIWFKTLIPRSINASSQYWSQKVLAISAINAAMMNVRYSQDLLPTFYLSKEFMLAALRTELPSDMLLDGIPFAFPAVVFMIPK